MKLIELERTFQEFPNLADLVDVVADAVQDMFRSLRGALQSVV